MQEHPQQGLPQAHGALVDAYQAAADVAELGALPDDGYILQALGHHLANGARLRDLRQLLMAPSWLEQKLQAYGRVAVVADFRRCPCASV